MHSLSKDTAKGFAWAAAGTAVATGVFWLFRAFLDKGQASLLYLPVVIACALRFGFAPALAGALLSFACWDFFFLPPYDTFAIQDPRDWLSLFVFLIAALSTAHLASEARRQTETARTREQETLTLYQAGEVVTREVDAARLLPALAQRLVEACGAEHCVILRRTHSGAFQTAASVSPAPFLPKPQRGSSSCRRRPGSIIK